MKKLYTILCCFLVSSSFAQNWRYNNYDLWSTDNWKKNSQQVSIYRPDGRLDTLLSNNYLDEVYSPLSRVIFSYDQQNKLTEKSTVSLSGAVQRQRTTFSYNNEGRLSEQIDLEWIDNSWEEINKSVLTYNADGTLALRLEQSPQSNGTYDDLYKLENSYSNGKLVTTTFSIFESGEWLQIERINYTYSGSGKLSTTISQFLVSDWENSRKQEYSYNPADSLISIRTDRWTEAETWENYMKSDFSYDNEGARNLEIVSMWEGSWKNFSRRRFENDPSVLSIEEFGSQFSLYPNPVTDRLNIVSGGAELLAVAFVDVTGKIVLTAEKTAEMTSVSTENLPAGVYNVVFSSEKGKFTKRIVKF